MAANWVRPALAPGGDLQLWKDFNQLFDQQISIAGRKVLEEHSWCLSDELVGLALFSDYVPVEEKAKIVARLSKQPGGRNVWGYVTRISSQASLGDFASRRTMELFSRLQIPDMFLAQQTQDWCHDEVYQRGREQRTNKGFACCKWHSRMRRETWNYSELNKWNTETFRIRHILLWTILTVFCELY